jgi:hypothetical protein
MVAMAVQPRWRDQGCDTGGIFGMIDTAKKHPG